jgi:hypothetical protein
MSLLWAARRGLSEAVILEILRSSGVPLPRIYWSPLFLAAEISLVNRSGLIGFFHDYFRQAVWLRYLRAEEDCRSAHLRLADYLQRMELSPRRSMNSHGNWRKANRGNGYAPFSAILRSLTQPGRRISLR